MSTCINCKHWQGKEEWGDCYRVIGSLQPKLFLCYNQLDEDTKEYFKVPFDPHDIKYWIYNDRFMTLCLMTLALSIKPGLRRVSVMEEDMKYDQHGAERLAVVKLHYFQTNKDYKCNLWEKNNGTHISAFKNR